MNSHSHVFSSESVTEGHPDKIADQISDAILDNIVAEDTNARVACETLVTTGMAIVAGEITTTAQVNYPAIIRDTIREIGYTHSGMGFDGETCAVMTTIDTQSPDIAQGVDTGGAGDQGMMFGYACDETPALMPLPITLAHALTKRLAEVRKNGQLPWLRPDGKSQVSVEYAEGRPVGVKTVVVSTQHSPDVDSKTLEEGVREIVINDVLARIDLDSTHVRHLINPTGRFVVGGPQGDAGLTGRKIIVDTYGGFARHGGGAFSGKDPSKVDRSAAYAARWVAKNVVAAGLARRCEVQLAYAIGVAEPVSIMVEMFGTGAVPETVVTEAIRECFSLTPAGIIEGLKLRNPVFQRTSAYGHFGREPERVTVHGQTVDLFTWEEASRVEELKEAANQAQLTGAR
jgi:S-adenosylmethionine synthetase